MFLQQLYKYPNFRKFKYDFAGRVKGTAMENWFNHLNWTSMNGENRNITAEISDAMRWLELWHDGGLYLDLDTITLRQTDHLRNVAGIQHDIDSNYSGRIGINGAVLQFSKPHHELLKPILETYIHDWRGNSDQWGVKGPNLLTKILQKKFKCCQAYKPYKPEKCKSVDFEVLERKAFYPILWRQKRLLNRPPFLRELLSLTKDSYVVHLWNRDTKIHKVRFGNKSFYDIAASLHCPMVYKKAKEKSKNF